MGYGRGLLFTADVALSVRTYYIVIGRMCCRDMPHTANVARRRNAEGIFLSNYKCGIIYSMYKFSCYFLVFEPRACFLVVVVSFALFSMSWPRACGGRDSVGRFGRREVRGVPEEEESSIYFCWGKNLWTE